MGVDVYAYAAWGLRTTRKAVKAAYISEKTWIGAEDVPQSARTEFDPTTGKPNYKVDRYQPQEIDEDQILCVGDYDSKEIVIPLPGGDVSIDSESGKAARASPEPSSEAFEAFRASMQKIGLWDKGEYGHWVFAYVSV